MAGASFSRSTACTKIVCFSLIKRPAPAGLFFGSFEKIMRAVLIAVLAVAPVACKPSYNPDDHLSAREKYDFTWKIIRYVGRAPENLTMEERFYKAYDSHYEEQMGLHRLDAYFERGGYRYFLISRRAPSLHDKRVATGGKAKIDADGNLVDYEEVFRTWKMLEPNLIKKGMMLFDKMVKGESLERYLTKNSWPEEYIEFPDDIVYFDKAGRKWTTRSRP
jgi:hypothetical protein